MFCDLIDRLKAASEEKYPERIWNIEFYNNMLFLWTGKEIELEKRVIKLEKENEENRRIHFMRSDLVD